MYFSTLNDPGRFLELSRPLLEMNEGANNLPIGLSMALRDKFGDQPVPPEMGRMAVLIHEGIPLGCLMQTPPRNLIAVAHPDHRSEVASAMLAYLHREDWEVPGVMAESKLALALTHELFGDRLPRTVFRQRAFELEEVIPPRAASGHMRHARPADRADVGEYILGFQEEALQGEERGLDPDALFDFWVGKGALYVWEDAGQVVSMAVSNRQTWNGAGIGYVYTPLRYRGRGYASNLVADLSQHILDRGKRFACLFTDLANPTSNKIYMEIGYRAVMDFENQRFL